MDLTPYTARGFPGDFDRIIAAVPVAGIDLAQARAMVRLCDATEPVLYGTSFSPRTVRYRRGARPVLESIVISLDAATDEARAHQAMRWTREHVRHPHLAGATPPDRAMIEEQLIASGRGWCNEQCRVFVALCEVMDLPARLCFLFHANGRTAHTVTEVLLDGRWSMHDVTYGVRLRLPSGGGFASARDLSRDHGTAAHDAYRDILRAWYARASAVERAEFDTDTAGDLFAAIGICNYLIDGVDATVP